MDLRSFLEEMRQRDSLALQSIDVSGWEFSLINGDAGALLQTLRDRGQKPILQLTGVPTGKGSPWVGSVLFSELSTHGAQMAALGLPNSATFATWADEWRKRTQHSAAPHRIPVAEAPVKAIRWSEPSSLMDLPIYRKDEWDARPGWLCGIIVGRTQEGRYNLSWHRLNVLEGRRGAMRVNPRHLWRTMEAYAATGQKSMPVAFVLGHHPAFELAAAAACAWEMDEYEFAGGIMGGALRVTPSETWGDALMVPADAECVVEGELSLEERDFCGPWADFMRYYSPQTLEPVFIPRAITCRANPIIVHNWTSHEALGTYHSGADMYATLRTRFPNVIAVASLAPFTYAIQLKQSRGGEAVRLGNFVLGAFGDRAKNVILVDDDIDPWDVSSVFYAMGTRIDADENKVQVIHNLLANRHDPSTNRDSLVGGLVIDATKPVGKPFPPLGKPPADAMAKIQRLLS